MNPLITEIKQLIARYETTEPDDIAEIGTLEVGTEIRWIEGELTPSGYSQWSRDITVCKRFVGPNNSVVDENGNTIYTTLDPSYRVRVISRPKPAPKPTALEQLPEGVREAIDNIVPFFVYGPDSPELQERVAQAILDNRAAIFSAVEPVESLSALAELDRIANELESMAENPGHPMYDGDLTLLAGDLRKNALALQANKGANQ